MRYLEDALRGEHLKKYLELDETLPQTTRTALFTALDIAAFMQNLDKTEDIMYFGGYAVLAQMVSVLGEDIINIWRGSKDVDFDATREDRFLISETYALIHPLRLHADINNKYTLWIDAGFGECKLDVYDVPFGGNKRYESEVIPVLGINMNVATPISLIRSKIDAALKAEVHRTDIFQMLYVLERRGTKPGDILCQLEDAEQAYKLKRVILEEAPREDRIRFAPTRNYFNELGTHLKNRCQLREFEC